ncbi:ATP-dependent nuclease [Agromyces albus]|uniref:ATP-dependent nuclease n=1 Tax=Agromyces albus TaxID=205332 RepID=UPI0013E99529|nr:AAA family ATPase [Agromyces albus]
MRLVRVEFQRLLGFKSVSIEVDPALQLIAGPNNAGKSTFVRLLELFFSNPDSESLLQHQPLNDYYAAEGPRQLSGITVHFGDLSAEEATVFAPIVRQRDRTFSVRLRSTRKGAISFDASRKPGAEEARRYYDEILDRFHFVKIPSIRVADGRMGDTDSLERLLETLESVLVRKGSARSTTMQQNFAAKIQPVEELVRDVLNHSADAIKDDLPFQENEVRFKLPEPRHALRGMLAEAVIESHGTIAVPVAERGTGFQSALVLGILRYVAQKEAHAGGNILFAIEEPEAFLHPQTQRAMAKIIRDISTDAQVIVTTHSSVLVDSFSVDRVLRLPLRPSGMEHTWHRPTLEATDVGRLTRYCSAANSELVFANAVIFVEGEGDFAVLEKLLGRLCGGPGGHYALGLTVIEAAGVSKIRYLVQLSELFGVRSYVLADRDSLHKRDGGKRELLDILRERPVRPDTDALNALRTESDSPSPDLATALARQRNLNDQLKPFDVFILAADLEGLLIDIFGWKELTIELGPTRLAEIDQAFVDHLLSADDGAAQLASWMGSKGWNSDGKKSGKLQPHVPALLVEEWMADDRYPGDALKPLVDWLDAIKSSASLAPV